MDQNQQQRVLDRIDTHDKDLAELRADISVVTQSVRHVADGQKLLGSKLDEITAALGSRGKASVQDVASYLQVIGYLFAIIGGVVTGIVYIANNASSADFRLLSHKVDRLYGSFGWEPTVRRTAPGN